MATLPPPPGTTPESVPVPPPGPPSSALTLAVAATELGVDYRTILRLAQNGHLPIYVPPGVTLGDGRAGSKGLRILRADWDAYLASRRFVGTDLPGLEGPTPVPPRPQLVPTGTDGISRLFGPRQPAAPKTPKP